MFIIVLGQHVSILIELSSGPSLSVKRESKQSNKKKHQKQNQCNADIINSNQP